MEKKIIVLGMAILAVIVVIAATLGMVLIYNIHNPEVIGLFIAFDGEIQDDKIDNIIKKIDPSLIWDPSSNAFMYQKYYIIVPKDNLSDIGFDNLSDNSMRVLYGPERNAIVSIIYYDDKSIRERDNSYIILLGGEASIEEARKILEPHNVEVKRIRWVYLTWNQREISIDLVKKWQSNLELEKEVLKTYLNYETSD